MVKEFLEHREKLGMSCSGSFPAGGPRPGQVKCRTIKPGWKNSEVFHLIFSALYIRKKECTSIVSPNVDCRKVHEVAWGFIHVADKSTQRHP